MSETTKNKQLVQTFIQAVWNSQNLAALKDFWTEDCINHAMPVINNKGLEVLHAYHESFFADFAAFSNVQIEILQQVAESDRVVNYLKASGEHSGTFFGIAPTGKQVSLLSIRIDRIQDDRIAEHWSVADLAGLMQQLQA